MGFVDSVLVVPVVLQTESSESQNRLKHEMPSWCHQGACQERDAHMQHKENQPLLSLVGDAELLVLMLIKDNGIGFQECGYIYGLSSFSMWETKWNILNDVVSNYDRHLRYLSSVSAICVFKYAKKRTGQMHKKWSLLNLWFLRFGCMSVPIFVRSKYFGT